MSNYLFKYLAKIPGTYPISYIIYINIYTKNNLHKAIE